MENMAETTSINPSVIEHWIRSNFDSDRIREQMVSQGHDEISIEAHILEFKKKKQLRKQGVGFIYIAVGSVIGFIGCVIAMVNPVPEFYHWLLYGFGTTSVLIIFIGLYQVFE